jgi:hypothetical protein
VLKSPNAIASVLFNIFSGVLATVTRVEKEGKFNKYNKLAGLSLRKRLQGKEKTA